MTLKDAKAVAEAISEEVDQWDDLEDIVTNLSRSFPRFRWEVKGFWNYRSLAVRRQT